MYKVIFDTDIGDDIDDSFALLYILRNKEVYDLKAVTTVFKNTTLRSKQARMLIELEGKDIDVYVGEGMPFDGYIPPFAKEIGQTNLVNNITPQYGEEMNDYVIHDGAVDKIIELAHKYSGELVFLMVGGATNLAKAIEKDPSITKDIKMIVAMSGNYSTVKQEWNVMCDPVGLDIVYKSGIPFYGVGCDITMKCPIENNLFEDIIKSDNKSLKSITIWYNRWLDYFHFEKSVLHDPLAVSTLADDKICKFKEIYAKVNTMGPLRGSIEVSDTLKEGFSKINVAYDVDKERLFNSVRKSFI